MGTGYELNLLGPPQLLRDGEIVRGFESRKSLAILCFLASHSQAVSRSQITDLFWPDKSEVKGRANLSGIVHNLTNLFPDSLRADRYTLQLKANASRVDLRAFHQYAAMATAESLAAAAALYRDEFLAGLYLGDCPDFEVWVVSERERWRQKVVSALECVSGFYLRKGEYEKAVSYAARLLEIEPWREESHRQMMELLALTGQRSAALQQYEICRRVLVEEFGIEPTSETTLLYHQIRRQDIASLLPVIEHETRYAKSGDIHIAYQVIGTSQLDLVIVPGFVTHVEHIWEEPLAARFYQRMSSFSRVIVFDKRGTGLSDRVAENDLPTLEERMDDVRAVMDAVGSERAALFSVSEGGAMCALFAATYPERTSALILFGSYARRTRSLDYPWGIQ